MPTCGEFQISLDISRGSPRFKVVDREFWVACINLFLIARLLKKAFMSGGAQTCFLINRLLKKKGWKAARVHKVAECHSVAEIRSVFAPKRLEKRRNEAVRGFFNRLSGFRSVFLQMFDKLFYVLSGSCEKNLLGREFQTPEFHASQAH
jgi:hypothetical protein